MLSLNVACKEVECKQTWKFIARPLMWVKIHATKIQILSSLGMSHVREVIAMETHLRILLVLLASFGRKTRHNGVCRRDVLLNFLQDKVCII